jgi:hypothetical protein
VVSHENESRGTFTVRNHNIAVISEVRAENLFKQILLDKIFFVVYEFLPGNNEYIKCCNFLSKSPDKI